MIYPRHDTYTTSLWSMSTPLPIERVAYMIVQVFHRKPFHFKHFFYLQKQQQQIPTQATMSSAEHTIISIVQVLKDTKVDISQLKFKFLFHITPLFVEDILI